MLDHLSQQVVHLVEGFSFEMSLMLQLLPSHLQTEHRAVHGEESGKCVCVYVWGRRESGKMQMEEEGYECGYL